VFENIIAYLEERIPIWDQDEPLAAEAEQAVAVLKAAGEIKGRDFLRRAVTAEITFRQRLSRKYDKASVELDLDPLTAGGAAHAALKAEIGAWEKLLALIEALPEVKDV